MWVTCESQCITTHVSHSASQQVNLIYVRRKEDVYIQLNPPPPNHILNDMQYCTSGHNSQKQQEEQAKEQQKKLEQAEEKLEQVEEKLEQVEEKLEHVEEQAKEQQKKLEQKLEQVEEQAKEQLKALTKQLEAVVSNFTGELYDAVLCDPSNGNTALYDPSHCALLSLDVMQDICHAVHLHVHPVVWPNPTMTLLTSVAISKWGGYLCQ